MKLRVKAKSFIYPPGRALLRTEFSGRRLGGALIYKIKMINRIILNMDILGLFYPVSICYIFTAFVLKRLRMVCICDLVSKPSCGPILRTTDQELAVPQRNASVIG